MASSEDATVQQSPLALPNDNPPDTAPTVDTDAQSVASDGTANSCRICRGDGTNEQPLFYPCKCSGSIRYVHQECLIEWLSHSKKKYCELCKTPFRFTKIYDQSMPATLPWPLFVRQLGVHIVSTAWRWSRYVLVATVWLIALPWCIRQVWRGLFWLADGSWLPETQRRVRMANDTSEPQTTTPTGANPGADDTANVVVVAFSSFMRFLAGESVAAKLFRLLFSVPPDSLGSRQTEQGIPRQRSGFSQRPPSLLSEVNFLKSWSTSSLARNLAIDVLEGLLICLGLVAGFVLVFLIREWVINQQPMLNEGDVDAARPVDILDDARRQRAIRRPRPRRVVREPGLAADDIPVGAQHMAPGRGLRRRAMTDDNIGAPTTQDPGRPDLPARAQSLVSPLSSPQVNEISYQNAGLDNDLPPPLMRGMVGEAVDARRILEETSSPNTAEAGSSTSAAPATPMTLADPRPGTIREIESRSVGGESVFTQLPTPPPEELSSRPGVQVTDGPIVSFRDNVSIIDGETTSLNTGESSVMSQASDVAAAASIPGGTDEEVPVTTTEVNGNVATTATDEPITAAPDSQEAGEINIVPQTRLNNFLAKVAHFFWFVEGVPDPSLHQDLPDTEEPNPPAEAPFVPAQNRAFPLLPEAFVEPPPPAAPAPDAAADIAQPFELNDPNALDDAEDLEGVLELVGMEGPLIGMVQNVVFSLLLISLTLAAAVWIPYIWGKIALILLANPVAVLLKAPVYIVTSSVDLVADVFFFVLGLVGIFFNIITKTVKATTEPILPAYARLLDTETFEQLAVNVTHQSGSRLEKTLKEAIIIFSPDLPTFSVQSHLALISFKASMAAATSWLIESFVRMHELLVSSPWSLSGIFAFASETASTIHVVPAVTVSILQKAFGGLKAAFRPQLKPLTLDISSAHVVALVDWSTQDKIIAIILGYVFFAFGGFLFMKTAHLFLGLKKNEKLEGTVADRFREAGGVLKVIIIIGIEMIVFPLYCGLLFDMALLPLFEGATVSSRLAFIIRAPFTGLFLHWFAGTCYMFHFALYVSMCRKILRKGVLYFIRDPDDPTFHPVRDVLERPVPTQLGKIAFSALVYGGLVIVCLGGVVWSVASVGNILPIRWTSSEPRLAFPLDVVFFNLAIPFLVRKTKPSDKVAAAYEWWLRGVAHGLRLSHFLFNEDREDERRPGAANGILSWRHYTAQKADTVPEEGTFVRAPASDSCRIPKNHRTFLEVTADNKRVDGAPDDRYGLHGRKNVLFAFFWLPPNFRARIATFVVLLWMFAAGTGIACTIGPLVLGRKVIQTMSGVQGPVNDLYALTLGMHLLAAIAYTCTYARTVSLWVADKFKASITQPLIVVPQIWKAVKYITGLVYLAVAFGIFFPFILSFITELYIHVPIFTFLVDREKFIAAAPGSSDAQILSAVTTLTESASLTVKTKTIPPVPPTVFILQTWTLGLLYLRLILRVAISYPCRHTRISTAIQMITRKGFWRPDVWLATRAVVIPLAILCTTLLIAPPGYVWLLQASGCVNMPQDTAEIYRLAYPSVMGFVSISLLLWRMKNRLAIWRSLVRDEVYLVGERLHNYASHTVGEDKGKEQEKGKARESRLPIPVAEMDQDLHDEQLLEQEHAFPDTPTGNVLINDW